ncbi:S1 RNA-binding domain-containing protein [bacterium]|nr:S1 RNA-binding domain-containing protein [bacterium]
MKTAKKLKQEIIGPPKIGEIVEGKIIEKRGNATFVDLGAKGIGVVYGDELLGAKNMLKELNVGSKISAKITKLETKDGYRALSIKEASQKLNWEKLIEKSESGETLEVKITGANKGGLLTKIMEIPAFLPVSQLSPKHYPKVEGGDPAKIVKALQKFVGQNLRVKIFNLNQRENKLILSERANEEEKTKEALKNYKVGDIVEGEITGVTAFGVFLKFGKGDLEGLVHISEMPEKKEKDSAKNFKTGEHHKAKIIEITGNRVYLSFKGL